MPAGTASERDHDTIISGCVLVKIFFVFGHAVRAHVAEALVDALAHGPVRVCPLVKPDGVSKQRSLYVFVQSQ